MIYVYIGILILFISESELFILFINIYIINSETVYACTIMNTMKMIHTHNTVYCSTITIQNYTAGLNWVKRVCAVYLLMVKSVFSWKSGICDEL